MCRTWKGSNPMVCSQIPRYVVVLFFILYNTSGQSNGIKINIFVVFYIYRRRKESISKYNLGYVLRIVVIYFCVFHLQFFTLRLNNLVIINIIFIHYMTLLFILRRKNGYDIFFRKIFTLIIRSSYFIL